MDIRKSLEPGVAGDLFLVWTGVKVVTEENTSVTEKVGRVSSSAAMADTLISTWDLRMVALM